jgi:hypothetical protein
VPGFFDAHGGAGQREEEAPEKITFERQWQADIELAYGEMGLLPEQFLEMRPCDWHARKRGHYRKEEKQWAQTRLIISALTGEAATKIIKLSFDEEKEIPKIADPEAAKRRILEKYKHLNPTP